jgi:glycosyltransferase involved in cell wall biosynthesis
MGVSSDRIFRFPYVAIPGFFDGAEIPEKRVEPDRPSGVWRMVTASELSDRKGIVPLVELLNGWCRQHRETQLIFTICGTGPLEPDIRRMQTEHNLRVVLRGHTDYAELADCFAKSDFFVFPTLSDEWGLVVNEALAAGLPLIGSRYSQAVEELIVDGYNGWQFSPDCPDEFYVALGKMLARTSDEMTTMRRNCRMSVVERTPVWAASHFIQAVSATLKTGG